MTEFVELDGKFKAVSSRTILQSQIEKCPFVIMVPEHYREDGTCKCDCPKERQRMIDEWDYTEEAFRKAGVIP